MFFIGRDNEIGKFRRDSPQREHILLELQLKLGSREEKCKTILVRRDDKKFYKKIRSYPWRDSVLVSFSLL